MKIISAFMVGSISVNVFLLGYIGISGPEVGPGVKLATAKIGTPKRAGWEASAENNSVRRKDSFWAQLNSDDLHVLRDHLTLAGFPPKLVAAMIKRAIYEKFAARYKALDPKMAWYYETAHFQDLAVYQTMAVGHSTPEIQQEAWRIYSERVALQTELLGRASVLEANFDDDDRFRYSFLPPEKAQAYITLDRDYAAITTRYDSWSNLSKDQQQLMKAEERKDLEALLTPQELFEFDVRDSSLTFYLQNRLRSFQPTEAEFRAMYTALNASLGPAAKENNPPVDWSKLNPAVQSQLETILGSERCNEFQQATDPNSTKLNVITQRLGLPLSAASQVVATQKEITEKAENVQNDTTLTSDQKSAILQALPDEASAIITATLGPSGFAAYKEYSGTWLEKLKANAQQK